MAKYFGRVLYITGIDLNEKTEIESSIRTIHVLLVIVEGRTGSTV